MNNPADHEPAHVNIFGCPVDGEGLDERAKRKEDRHRAREERRQSRARRAEHHESSLGTGVLLFVAGIILLLNALNIVSWDIWLPIERLWPILIILLGLNILLGRSVLARLIMLAITLAAVAYAVSFALVSTGSPFAQYVPGGLQAFIRFAPAQGPQAL